MMAREDTAKEQQYVTATQAAQALGTTRAKIAELLRSGALPYESDPLDGRVKLIPREKVDALKRLREERRVIAPKTRKGTPSTSDGLAPVA